MQTTVLMTGAGGGGTNNLIRDLRTVDRDVVVIGSQMEKYLAAKSLADRTYILPVATDTEAYIEKMNAVIAKERIDLVIPNSDREVATLSENRQRINARTFLPSKAAVRLCQDKWPFYEALSARGIPMAKTCHVRDLGDIRGIFENELSGAEMLWCRPRTGSGSKGATKVQSAEQARFWVKYWHEVRGYPVDQFLLSEYLPGRDVAVQSTWKDGELKIMKILERLSYYGGDARPSGMSSTPQVARTLYDKEVLKTCRDVARIVQDKPNGNFNFDLKQDRTGRFCLTEVNIGRFFLITSGFDLTGRYNMIDTYIRLALGRDVRIDDPIDIEEGMYLVRDLDTEPLVISQKQLDESAQTI